MSRETRLQAVCRHLGNGAAIVRRRGGKALAGAALLEIAKLLGGHSGPVLAGDKPVSDALAMLREQGGRTMLAAAFRRASFALDPPPPQPDLDVSGRYRNRYALTLQDGVTPARRLLDCEDFALRTPFGYAAAPHSGRVAAVIHAFYPEILPALLACVAHIPCAVDLFISTDTQAKRAEIERLVADWSKGSNEIRVLPNRGRDIAAKFVGFRDVYAVYDVFLHLHTKKSPHGGEPLSEWLDHLVGTLIGSPEIAASNLSLFDDKRIGVVFAQHLPAVRGLLNWGYDYDIARSLARRMGFDISKNLPLEFPSGSMFWGRSAAIRPLLDAGLAYEEFPAEAGQIDGTIAHAIERLVLMIAESCGFEWLKVGRADFGHEPSSLLAVDAPERLPDCRVKTFQPVLAGAETFALLHSQHHAEARPLLSYPSRNTKPRLNLLVPTINPHQTFGGVATALRVFDQIADALGADFDRRIIATDAAIDSSGRAAFPSYEPRLFAPTVDPAGDAVVDAYDRADGRLDLRASDIFVATAWWTAAHARSLGKDRRRMFGADAPFVYVIQDDEPHFYSAGARSALAEATYACGEDILAILNSEELYATMIAKHRFRAAFCLPYAINAAVSANLTSRPRERIILVYARPSVERNAYPLIRNALAVWQQRDPVRASRWRIVFLGEAFDGSYATPVQNVSIEGKVDLPTYADYLSRASVGLSLMLSPHPSYPPLEMAEAGLATIANDYEGKILARRFPDIRTPRIDVESLAEEIESAVAAMEPQIGRPSARVTPKALDVPAVYDASTIAALVRKSIALSA